MNETTEAVQYKYSKPNVFAVVEDIKFHFGMCRRSAFGRNAKFGAGFTHRIFNSNVSFLLVGHMKALNRKQCHVAVRSSPATYGKCEC